MKNSLPAILLPATLLLSAFLPQQQTSAPSKKDLGIPPTWEAQVSESDTIRQLLKKGLYDSAISHCAAARAANRLGYSTQEMALATAYWYKGDKSRAYQYIQNDADYQLSLNGGGGNPFSMLYDYSFGDALANDSFLVQMITDRVKVYYATKMEYYPERNTGLKLMLLDYNWEKLRMKYFHDLEQYTDAAGRETLQQAYEEASASLADKLIALIRDNGDKLYTDRDIGPAENKQFTMFSFFSRPADQAFAETLLRKALEEKKISPDTYVYQLLSVARNSGRDEKQLLSMQDSLCRIYKCRRSVTDSEKRTVTFYTADQPYSVSMDSLYSKGPGSGIDSILELVTRPGRN